MLIALFGNRTVEQILIFLFVNGKCYGTGLHRKLKIPLTPIQNALGRLEKGGVILSHYEGKTRLYQFNPTFLLLEELEQLLKRAYTLLSPEEKKRYYVSKEETKTCKPKVLQTFWEKLRGIRHFSLNTKSKSKDEKGWSRKGRGDVEVIKESDNSLLFQEKGKWQGKQVGDVNFNNVFRWTLDRGAELVSLEHLRRGVNHPVFLLHLTPSSNCSLSPVDSHICGGDVYFGQIIFDHLCLRLNWRVIGPKKNEEIDCYYS